MKKVIFSGILFIGLLSSCSELAGTEEKVNVEIPSELPNAKEFTEGLNQIVKKAGFSSVEEIEFFDLDSDYNESSIPGNNARVYIKATVVSKEDKNTLMNYEYDFETGTVNDGEEVTLTSGFGSNEEIVEGYDSFKSNLFKSSDIAPFSKMDEMKQIALDNSGYKKDEQYIASYSAGFNNIGRFESYMYVKNKKVRTMSKPIYFDKNGGLKK